MVFGASEVPNIRALAQTVQSVDTDFVRPHPGQLAARGPMAFGITHW